jgi:hypothetical protein
MQRPMMIIITTMDIQIRACPSGRAAAAVLLRTDVTALLTSSPVFGCVSGRPAGPDARRESRGLAGGACVCSRDNATAAAAAAAAVTTHHGGVYVAAER